MDTARKTRALIGMPAIILMTVTLTAVAQVTTWTGGGDGSDWFDDANWDHGVPPDGTAAVIDAGGVLLTNATADLSAFMMTGGMLTFDGWNTWLTATHVVLNGGIITHATNTAVVAPWTPSARVRIVCHDLSLAAGAAINTDFRGYMGGTPAHFEGYGPAAGLRRRGAGHGGYGGKNNSLSAPYPAGIYGSRSQPELPGSGGGDSQYAGDGGAGGGVVRIMATGHVTLDGSVSANGEGPSGNYPGGGAGGSIRISCRTLTGVGGVVRARGGSVSSGPNYGGAGGGGRIAVDYDPDAQAALAKPSITFSAAQGRNTSSALITWDGSPGTVHFPDGALLDAGRFPHAGHLSFDRVNELVLDRLMISNSFVAFSQDGFRLAVSNDVIIMGTQGRLNIGGDAYWTNVYGNGADFNYYFYSSTTSMPVLMVGGDLTVTNGGQLYVYGGRTNAATADYGAWVDVAGDVTVAGNGVIVPQSQPLNGGSPWFRARNFHLATNGTIHAAQCGFYGGAAGYGPGWPPAANAGGGHGGRGGTNINGVFGPTYGDPLRPVHPGSGGRGADQITGRGGGLFRLDASGTVRLDGVVHAWGGKETGDTTLGPGGAGGGIFIRCREFAGESGAALRANGGPSNGQNRGGGGGGRIAVWYGDVQDLNAPTRRLLISDAPPPTFDGAITVAGGAGSAGNGQPGTVRFVRVLRPFGTILLMR